MTSKKSNISGNKKLAIILMSLVPLVLYYIFSDGGGTLRMGPDLFAITDTEQVVRIAIDKQGHQIVLEKEEHGWVLNGQHGADARAVQQLIHSLSMIRMRAPVGRSELESVQAGLADEGTKVSVSSARRTLQQYVVWQQPQTGRTFMVHHGRSNPLEVHVPGLETPVGAFCRTSALYWRDNRLIGCSPSQISKIRFVHERDRFTLVRQQDELFTIDGQATDPFRVESYLQSLQVVNLSYDEDTPEAACPQDQIYAKLEIFTKEQDSIGLVFYKIPLEPYLDEFGHTIHYDMNQLCLERDGKKASIRYLDVDPLLKRKTYFLSAKH